MRSLGEGAKDILTPFPKPPPLLDFPPKNSPSSLADELVDVLVGFRPHGGEAHRGLLQIV